MGKNSPFFSLRPRRKCIPRSPFLSLLPQQVRPGYRHLDHVRLPGAQGRRAQGEKSPLFFPTRERERDKNTPQPTVAPLFNLSLIFQTLSSLFFPLFSLRRGSPPSSSPRRPLTTSSPSPSTRSSSPSPSRLPAPPLPPTAAPPATPPRRFGRSPPPRCSSSSGSGWAWREPRSARRAGFSTGRS